MITNSMKNYQIVFVVRHIFFLFKFYLYISWLIIKKCSNSLFKQKKAQSLKREIEKVTKERSKLEKVKNQNIKMLEKVKTGLFFQM